MKWIQLNPDGVHMNAQHGHRAVEIEDGLIIYGGGNQRISNHLHLYSIHKNKNQMPMVTGTICHGVASFGMIRRNNKIIIFGGMEEYRVLSNKLFTLDVKSFNWSLISNAIKQPPEPRIGHSFTLVDENRALVFGGITNTSQNPRKHFLPCYMNDLYVLHVYDEKFAWEKIDFQAEIPSPRDSHSAVVHDKNLIIFGGTNDSGERLNDLWFLNIHEFMWTKVETLGIPPAPRSLHSASLFGSRMYVFGGWQKDPVKCEDKKNLNYISSNSLSYLDLVNNEWNSIDFDNKPPARAGHCAVVANNRIYIISGRNKYIFVNQKAPECLYDFWYLEIDVPLKINQIELVSATTKTIELKWQRSPNANSYLLEICRITAQIKFNTDVAFKLVGFNNKSLNLSMNSTKRKNDDSLTPMMTKKVIKIGKFEQIDGCNDENGNDSNLIDQNSQWKTVGIFKNHSCLVECFFNFAFNKAILNDENCPPHFTSNKRYPLACNTKYAFRIAGINSCGTGEMSPMYVFETYPEGWPIMPQNCKFIKTLHGLRLCWNPQENVKDYKVEIRMMHGDDEGIAKYVRIYIGNQPTCEIKDNMIKNQDYQFKKDGFAEKEIWFRISAMNEKGTGPFLETSVDIKHDWFEEQNYFC